MPANATDPAANSHLDTSGYTDPNAYSDSDSNPNASASYCNTGRCDG